MRLFNAIVFNSTTAVDSGFVANIYREVFRIYLVDSEFQIAAILVNFTTF